MAKYKFISKRRGAPLNPEKIILSGLKSRRPRRAFRLVVVGLLLAALYAWLPLQEGERTSGGVMVVDGDTLDMKGTRLRLYGIDAPESNQNCRKNGKLYACGRESAEALAAVIGDNLVSCEEQDVDIYGRIVAICYAGETELNRWMVANGQAVVYQQYAIRYLWDEIQARSAGKGLWGGSFEKPWDFRHRVRTH